MYTVKSNYRLVKTIYPDHTNGLGANKYARNRAGHIAAELHLAGYPGAQIQIVGSHHVDTGFGYTYYHYGVYSDAPEEVVRVAEQACTSLEYDNPEDLDKRILANALNYWYSAEWVPAARHCAIMYFLTGNDEWAERCRAAQMMFSKSEARAFFHELDQSVEELGEAYGPFYYGHAWEVHLWLHEEVVVTKGREYTKLRKDAIAGLEQGIAIGKEMLAGQRSIWPYKSKEVVKKKLQYARENLQRLTETKPSKE